MAKNISQTAHVQSHRGRRRWRHGVGGRRTCHHDRACQAAIDRRLDRRRTQMHRPYWEPTYSGGPMNVTPLPPGALGRTTSRSSSRRARRCRLQSSTASKFFISLPRRWSMPSTPACGRTAGATTACEQHRDRGRRGRPRADLRDEPLARATAVHWHGIYLPNGMDGVGGPDAAVHQARARRSNTSSRCGSTARSCTTPTTTR